MIFDIAIIGAGPAGAACALTLSKAGKTCCVIERQSQGSFKPGEIMDSKIMFPLSRLGLWNAFLKTNPLRASGTFSAWGGDFVYKDSMIDPYGGAYFVDRVKFEQLLRDNLGDTSCAMHCGINILSCNRVNDHWQLAISNRKQVRYIGAKFLIEATGRGRMFAEHTERVPHDNLIGLVGYTSKLSPGIDLRFCIESRPTGWAYYAPLPNEHVVLAYLTDMNYLPRGNANVFDYFKTKVKELQLAEIFPIGSFKLFKVSSARTYIRKRLHGDKWIAIGESASCYDPLAGFGVVAALNKGLNVASSILDVGEENAGRMYQEYETKLFSQYLQTRHSIYSQEDRWPEESFWKVRHANPGVWAIATGKGALQNVE